MTPRPIVARILTGSIIGAAYTQASPSDQATTPLRHIPVCARCGAARCEHSDHDWSGTPKS